MPGGQQQQQPKKRQKFDNNNSNSSNNGNQQQKKKKKNRKNNNKNKKKRFQQRREKYWIEDCQETGDRDAIASAALTVLITRTELTDNHTFKKKDEVVSVANGDSNIPEADDTVDELEAGSSTIDNEAKSTKFEHDESTPVSENDTATLFRDQAFKCAAAIVAECDNDSKKAAVVETVSMEAENSSSITDLITAEADRTTDPSVKAISGISSDIETTNDTKHAPKSKTQICVRRDPSANTTPKKVRILKNDLCVCVVCLLYESHCTYGAHSIILTPVSFLSFRGNTFARFRTVTVETESRIHTQSTSLLINTGHSAIDFFPGLTKGFNSIKRAGILSPLKKLPIILLSR